MSQAYKRFGASNPTLDTNASLYQVPSHGSAIIDDTGVTVCNIGSADALFRIAHVDGAISSVANEDYAVYDYRVPANSSFENCYLIGRKMSAGDSILVRASTSNVSFSVAGLEIIGSTTTTTTGSTSTSTTSTSTTTTSTSSSTTTSVQYFASSNELDDVGTTCQWGSCLPDTPTYGCDKAHDGSTATRSRCYWEESTNPVLEVTLASGTSRPGYFRVWMYSVTDITSLEMWAYDDGWYKVGEDTSPSVGWNTIYADNHNYNCTKYQAICQTGSSTGWAEISEFEHYPWILPSTTTTTTTV